MKKFLVFSSFLIIPVLMSGCLENSKTENSPAPAPAAATVTSSSAIPNDYAIKTKRASDAVKATDFSLPNIKGGTVNLADFKGKVIIVDFWATWCPPCKAEIPDFIALHEKYGKDGFVMIGVAIDDPAKVKSFVKARNVNYIICIGDQNTTNNYGGIRGIPTTFVIDKEGYVVREYVGFRPKDIFEQDILDLM